MSPGAGANQSCVTANNCFSPNVVNIATGDTVTWTNDDNVGHTTTSGMPSDNQTGTIWDSSLVAAGKSYSFTFQNAGDYHYHCMVHPWMIGEVIVGASSQQPTPSTSDTATINTKFGNITIQLLDNVAPQTVANFEKLANSHFYDGTIFHRIVPGFVIQGGDPNTKSGSRDTWGTGDAGYTIPPEFSSMSFSKYTVGMARGSDVNSGSSQFFITVGDASFLNGKYTLFGQVISGQDVVDKIASLPTDSTTNQPSNPEDARVSTITIQQTQPQSNPPSPNASITVSTDKSSYNYGDTITISGKSSNYISNALVTIIIRDTVGNVVKSDQVILGTDQTFSTTLTATGPLWQAAGTYTVYAQLGTAESATTTFQFSGSSGTPSGPSTIPVDGTNWSVSYTIINGKVLDIKADPALKSLTVSIQTTGDGLLTITMPRALIDATNSDGTDTKFIVLNDGQENAQAIETLTTNTDRTLTIPLKNGAQQLAIVGTEFLGQSTAPISPPIQSIPSQQQIQLTSGGTIDVGFSTNPSNPTPGSQTSLQINFINKQSGSIQPHIDYKVLVIEGNNQVFGIPVTHTAQGSVSIPVQLQDAATYKVIVEVDGILFQPIPPETATFSLVVGTGQNNPTPSQTYQVTITPGASATRPPCTPTDCYNPQVLYISPGATVTWTNADTVGHTTTSGNPSDNRTGTVWDSSLIKAGGTYSFTFQNAGTYNYFCQVHPWMTGQIIVGAAATSSGTGSTTTSGNMTGTSGNMSSTSGNQTTPVFTQPIPPAILSATPQDLASINQAKANQTIAAEVNVGANQSQITSIDNNVSIQTTQNTPDSLNVDVSASSQTSPKVIAFNLNATTINVANLKDLGVMYDGKLIQPASNIDAILHAKPTDNPSFAIIVTQSGVQVLVLVPHFSTHSITITNMSKVISAVPEFGPLSGLVIIISIIGVLTISRKFTKGL